MMVIRMRAHIQMEPKVATVSTNGYSKTTNTKATGATTKSRVSAFPNGKMAAPIKVTSSGAVCMVKASTNGQNVVSTKAHSSTT